MMTNHTSEPDPASQQRQTPKPEPTNSAEPATASAGEIKIFLPPKGWRFVPMKEVEHLLTPRQRRMAWERREKKAGRELPKKNLRPAPTFGYLNQDAPNPQLPETGSSDSEA